MRGKGEASKERGKVMEKEGEMFEGERIDWQERGGGQKFQEN